MSTIEQLREMSNCAAYDGARPTIDLAICELESLQKACAEMRSVLECWLDEEDHTGIYPAARHAISTDCGKDYVHISGQEKLAAELDRVEEEYTKQLQSAQQRVDHMRHCCEMALQNLDKGSTWKQYDPSWIRPRQMTIPEIKECCEQAYHWISRALAAEVLRK